jgi:hypothetical protein
MKKYLNILALTAGASLVGAVSVQAQLIAYDGFNYSSFDTTLAPNQQLSGGSGDWKFSWFDKSPGASQPGSQLIPGMSYSTLPVVGNSIGQVGNNGTTQLWRVLGSNLGYYGTHNGSQANTVWMSYIWASDNTGTLDPGGSGNYLFRQASLGFYVGGTATTTAGSEYLDVGMPNISATSASTVTPNISLWYGGHGLAGQTGSATAPNVQSSVAANNYNQNFILIQMLLDGDNTTADTMNIWINPTLGVAPGTPNMSYALQNLSAIDTFRFSANGNNATFGGYGIQQTDELRIGQTMDSVETMSVANIVPEPVSMVLLGFSSLSLLLFRRNK